MARSLTPFEAEAVSLREQVTAATPKIEGVLLDHTKPMTLKIGGEETNFPAKEVRTTSLHEVARLTDSKRRVALASELERQIKEASKAVPAALTKLCRDAERKYETLQKDLNGVFEAILVCKPTSHQDVAALLRFAVKEHLGASETQSMLLNVARFVEREG